VSLLAQGRPHGEPSAASGARSPRARPSRLRLRRALRWALRHRLLTVLTIFGLFVSSCFLVKKIGSEFFPETDEGSSASSTSFPSGRASRKRSSDRAHRKGHRLDSRADEGRRKGSTALHDGSLGHRAPRRPHGPLHANTGSHSANIGVNLVSRQNRPISDVEATERVRAA